MHVFIGIGLHVCQFIVIEAYTDLFRVIGLCNILIYIDLHLYGSIIGLYCLSGHLLVFSFISENIVRQFFIFSGGSITTLSPITHALIIIFLIRVFLPFRVMYPSVSERN